jgi:hypothetical protein
MGRLMPSSNQDLTTDRWTMSGQWPSRPEDMTRCADRLLRFLEGIGRIHSSLRQWYSDGEPVTPGPAELTDLLRDSQDSQFAEHGWKAALWNGVSDPPAQSTFTVTCGATVTYFKNDIELVLPRPANQPELFQLDTMRELVEVTVSAWSPTWCAVYPRGFRKAAPRGDSLGVFASWIAYLDHDLIAGSGGLPDGVRRLDVARGSLFVMAPTPTDLSIDAVDAVQRAVQLDPSWRLSP